MSEASPAHAEHSTIETNWYLLDKDHRIVEVSGSWDAFAQSNQGEGAKACNVVGTSVYDHIVGHFTQRFFKEFLAAARLKGQGARQTYRCDAPHLRRFMEMTAVCENNGFIRISHAIIATRPLDPPIYIYQPPVQYYKTLQIKYSRCSICNRIRDKKDSVWKDPEEINEKGNTLKVIHTVCEQCRAGITNYNFNASY